MTRSSSIFRAHAAPPGPEFRIAAIDVGSNSLHMVVAQADPDGGVTTLWRMKEMVGVGRISFPSKKLTPGAMGRALGTLRRVSPGGRGAGGGEGGGGGGPRGGGGGG